ncbi:hypothetical protein HDG34_003287 [Paraburkholderia sp. HC6.4b]|uniref:hypothetical protein n=1 Tax=unclassified Paraburkholderia TaxID=2615204 RepID=UPI00161ACD32|nr:MULTISPECIES: hypothetical protein [unclassified Paraburkholderia]MBB5409346.1 hypothetical protein [Paraburkholderia sp. HC6.4b]MBB5451074.1 hypothetical protein [Paraburkholderia sp. Kb1A]
MNIEPQEPGGVPAPVAYGDPRRLNSNGGSPCTDGQLRPDAPIPARVESCVRRLERAIYGAMMFDQHEYLEHRRLPHTLRTWEVRTTPWLLEDGYILALTDFPVATETCCVVAFTPVYADGRTAMDRSTQTDAMSLEVVDYEVFTYQERGHTAYENARMILHPRYLAELRRQAFALKLQYIQFFYFTQLIPKVREAFEDPEGHLERILERLREVSRAGSSPDQPTPVGGAG